MKNTLRFLAVAGFCAAPLVAGAQQYYQPYDGPLSGTQNLLGYGNWGGSTLAWDISSMNGVFKYEYTFTVPSAGTGISHLWLEFSTNCASDNGNGGILSECFRNFETDDEDGVTYGWGTAPEGNGDPGFPMNSSFTGLKFDDVDGNVFSFSFDSDRAPMFGNVYAKGGNAGEEGCEGEGTPKDCAFNSGLIDLQGDGMYVPTPNTVCENGDCDPAIVPEPASFALMLGGLFGFGVVSRRRRTV